MRTKQNANTTVLRMKLPHLLNENRYKYRKKSNRGNAYVDIITTFVNNRLTCFFFKTMYYIYKCVLLEGIKRLCRLRNVNIVGQNCQRMKRDAQTVIKG